MRIAYLTTCFGIQSHTFIRREIFELEKLGLDIRLYGVRHESSENLTDSERALVNRTRYLYPLNVIQVVLWNLYWSVFKPVRYWPNLWRAINNGEKRRGPRLKLIYHFFVSVPLARDMQRAGIRHIHAHFLNVSASVAMYASLLSGIPYSATVHSAGTRNAPHIIGIPMKLRYARFLIMISHYNIRYFDEIYPCAGKSTVVRCGMDLDNFPFREPAAAATAGAGDKPLHIVAVGRMVEKKGFRFLLDALALAVESGHAMTVELVGSGPLEQALRRQAADAQLGDYVTFFGQASTAQVQQRMLAADVVVVPSVTSQSGEMEGIPVVLMEAMALGVPVIASEHSGIPELVRNGETGLTVPERDAEALSAALVAFAGSPSDRKRWVDNARYLIEKEFNITVVAAQRRDLFQHSV